MNWKQEAIDTLRTYAIRKQALTTLPVQLEEVQLRQQGIQAATAAGSPIKGGENMLLDTLVCQEELERRLEMTRQWVQAVEDALGALTDEERLVLDLFYIHPEPDYIEQLCVALGIENPPGVYKRKDRALRRFVMALYGWEEV